MARKDATGENAVDSFVDVAPGHSILDLEWLIDGSRVLIGLSSDVVTDEVLKLTIHLAPAKLL